MTIRVLVVDDSSFFRHRIVELLEQSAGIEVVGTAANGREALVQVMKLQPDAVTMDIEMPVMDGISAVRRLMGMRPTPVLMLSSLTREGAKATLDALDAGAMDFMPKRMEDMARGHEAGASVLREKVRAIVRGFAVRSGQTRTSSPAPSAPPARTAPPPQAGIHRRKRVTAIGCSTGGPVALAEILTALPASYPLPLLLIQHMPAAFTPAFAERLNGRCAIRVREARDRDAMEPGLALLAPGGKQLIVESGGAHGRVRVVESQPEQHYRPSVDTTFSSLAKQFPGAVLALVLTGMGADGREGATELFKGGSEIWAQDEASCVVYGMPAAVVQAGLARRVLPLDQLGPELAKSR